MGVNYAPLVACATLTLAGCLYYKKSQGTSTVVESIPGTRTVSPGVYLVGAGPSSVDLLTLRAFNVIRQAEVMVVDELIGESIKALIPPNCEVVTMGKRGGNKNSTPQTDINSTLVRLAQASPPRVVVRLKGGDPLVFGRAFEEMVALEAAGCRYEVVPGMSSALVAPVVAGIPTTHKMLGRNFAVLSAHNPDNLDWVPLAGIDTLLILMGTRTLPQVCSKLENAGRDPSLPVAVVRWAGDADKQEVVTGTLASIVKEVGDRKMSPAVIIVGAVAQFALGHRAAAAEEEMEGGTSCGVVEELKK